MRILLAPDKFRGTISAIEAARALSRAVERAGDVAFELPLADGGEGTLAVFGEANRETIVAGPNLEPVRALWRRDGHTAYLEMAQASGLALCDGPENNDPIGASTRGTGELIASALGEGAKHVVLGVGGSATTDGGKGAVDLLDPVVRFGKRPDESRLEVLCDVNTIFLDAARCFGPQKGATPDQVRQLSGRLSETARELEARFGIDIRLIRGSGAAGGLAGGLAALGASLVPGFDRVAELVGLDTALDKVDLVVTGEGSLDTSSFAGKVVGGLLRRCDERGIPLVVIAGRFAPGLELRKDWTSLTDSFGQDAALNETARCLEEALLEILRAGH